MKESEKRNAPSGRIVVALGFTIIVLTASLTIAIGEYITLTSEKNTQISNLNSSYDSAFQLLLPRLQNESTPILDAKGATFVSINQINLDPAKWINQMVVVVGKLTGPWAYPEAISYYYVISSTDSVTSSTGLPAGSIGVDFGNRGAIYNGSIALVVGEIKKGTIGTNSPRFVYYIEEQAVALL